MHFVRRPAERATPADIGWCTSDVIVGPEEGSVHLRTSVDTIQAGSTSETHAHAFEEGFYVLSGTAVLETNGFRHRLRPGDFGVVPVGADHLWEAVETASLYVVGSPQPRGKDFETVERPAQERAPLPELPPPFADPRTNFIGHFDERSLPPPGGQQQAGYHGSGVDGVSISMLVDAQLGADHMNLFVVEFRPGGGGQVHDHPYEESYFLLEGKVDAELEGATYHLAAGDAVWTSVGASHGFFNRGTRKVRWLETQTPQPPRRNGHRFIGPWRALSSRTV